MLAQVSTSDGRIKVLGQDGLELSLYCSSSGSSNYSCGDAKPQYSPCPCSTQQLLFLPNKGGIVRLNKVGFLMEFAGLFSAS
jgi:hypothetical protein